MARYEVLFRNPDAPDRVVGIESNDDLAAIQRAIGLYTRQEIEIREGGRRVATLEATKPRVGL